MRWFAITRFRHHDPDGSGAGFGAWAIRNTVAGAHGGLCGRGQWGHLDLTEHDSPTDGTETCPLDPSDCTQRSLASQRSRRVMPTDQALVMQTLLRSVIQSGTGRAASLGGQEGGKTGTTNQGRDLTFIGYEPKRHWVMGVWLGNDDNSPTGQTSAVAAGLWRDCLLYTSPSPRDYAASRMPSSA